MGAPRDYTKYVFQGQTLGKARLVLELVKRYVHEHPAATFEDLISTFPDSLQADSPLQFDSVRCVVRRLQDVPRTSQTRFFLGDGEIIDVAGQSVAVSREWNLHNIKNVLEQAKRLGFDVTVADTR